MEFQTLSTLVVIAVLVAAVFLVIFGGSRHREEHPAAPDVSERPRRRWYQFSLKVLLVIVTMTCIGPGGYLVYKRSKGRKQKTSVEAIEALGGHASMEDHRSNLVRQIYGNDWREFGNVYSISLSGTQVTDADLVHLFGLNGLKSLHLDNTLITDAGLLHLAKLKSLEYLDLSNTRTTDSGAAALQKALPNCSIYREGKE